MRKLIVCNIISVDGYYSGPDNNVMVMPFDYGFDLYNAERLRAATTLLLGRSSFEGFRSYWPEVVNDERADETNREISRLDNAIDKVVISDSLRADETAPWTDSTRIIKRADAYEQIAALKQEEGGDILVFASHKMWNDLLVNGLVDEVHLMVGARFLGTGVPVFEDQPPVDMQLIAPPQTWEGSNLVLLKYGPKKD